MSLLLQVSDVSRRFGGLAALDKVSFSVNAGEMIGIIGPNGAGKTTLFNVITGVSPPTKGRITLDGEDVTGLQPHQIARKGIVRTFQADVLFHQFSVVQNVLVGLHIRSGLRLKHVLFSRSSASESEMRWASEILEVVGLIQFKNYLAGDLPHGHQRILGIAMALAAEPKILLLDEPVTGMNVDERRFIVDLITALQSKGTTILLVEHDIRTVVNICSRIIVLNFGRKIAEGSPDEIRRNRDVVEAYLGPEIA